jgi:hypothetical protein
MTAAIMRIKNLPTSCMSSSSSRDPSLDKIKSRHQV